MKRLIKLTMSMAMLLIATSCTSSSSEDQSMYGFTQTTTTESTRKTSSNRCQATTKKGTQCKRKAQKGSDYCWQHQNKH